MGLDYLGRFNELVESILTKTNRDSLLDDLLGKLRGLFGAQRSTFYFYDQQAQELWSYIATDLEIKAIRVPLGRGVVGVSAQKKKIVNVKDAYKCKFFNPEIDKKTGFHTKTILASPLINQDGSLLGVVQLLNKKDGCFDSTDESLIKSISYYIVIALNNIRLLQEKEVFVRSTIYALTGALDAKDQVTSGHSYRVAYYSLKIARALGYTQERINTLEYAAYLHDVGKIGIPDVILQKKDRLTPEEYQEIKKHPAYTLKILKNILFPKEDIQIPHIAASHHEFLDGSGYPAGLKGGQIDKLSRIIAVADIYDALAAFDRPYKKHLSIKEALNILKQEAEKGHLDKDIVEVFINKKLYQYERRAYQRLKTNVLVNFLIIPQRKVIKDKLKDIAVVAASDLEMLKQDSAWAKDISQGGVLVSVKQYMPIGTYLDLSLGFPSWKMRCIGKVVWIENAVGTASYSAGVSFVNLSDKFKQKIMKKLVALPVVKE